VVAKQVSTRRPGEIFEEKNKNRKSHASVPLTKKILLRVLLIRGMTFKFEYLSEFEFIFESNLK
jgi:hypothetical protein